MIQFSQQKKHAIGEVNLTPMIDIIFNLLIFFLIIAVISQKGLSLTLPKASTAEKRPKKTMEIMVTADRRILFDGSEVAEQDVERRLRAEHAKREGEQVESIILKADTDAPFGSFVMVMDTARRIGLKNLVIATKIKSADQAGGTP